MDKNNVILLIESASCGKCTVIYDDDGYPSIMYKIPKVSIGSLASSVGSSNDIHPAFVVNGSEKDVIYMSMFMTSLYNGHYVSWFGLSPTGSITIPDLRVGIANKGTGWHLETIYERSLLALLAMNLNSPEITGNTDRGRSHIHPWEYCQLTENILPGTATTTSVKKYINGSQPPMWSHNKENWGIQDVIGGFHEICDLMKVVNGKIYCAADNNFFSKESEIETFETTWEDTGVAYDYINGNITLNTTVTNIMDVEYYVSSTYKKIMCSTEYDELPLTKRQKMCLLLLSSRLSSASEPIFEINGRFNVANNKLLCYGVFGGAEQYKNSGLGSVVIGYPIDDPNTEGHTAHTNMGSRMVFIP